ncbi:MAG: PRC-barrel domain-containing protein [Alphaproteobacteria bacterium]|nr:PRC-barrel domain-containing protein [Alphaproteobacteria bacterium]MBU0859377.1 PRC-barrel domain-containing protein [Alphaproteobacteria bacterium]
MKMKFLTAVSAVAIMSAGVAMAETKTQANSNTQAQVGVSNDRNTGSNHNRDLATVPPVTGADIERGLDDAGEAISDAADSVAEGTEDAYESIRAALIDEENTREGRDVNYADIKERHTAVGMIGQDVRNNSGEAVAKVEDIILDKDGNAMLVVVANGGFMGLGEKKAAFDYDAITRQNAAGDVIMPLTEASIKTAAEFSYDVKASGENVRMIPTGGVSTAKLLKGKLVDSEGKAVANVQNIVLGAGGADRVIVAFDDVMGMGGERAALRFKDLKLTQTDTSAQFQLSAAQSTQFEAYKAAAKRSN